MVFRKKFKVDRSFSGPVDLYVIKDREYIVCYQVSDKDLKIQGLFHDISILDVPDYVRLSKKHNFSDTIEIDCVDDLVLVDDEICEICKFPELLSLTSNSSETLCYN